MSGDDYGSGVQSGLRGDFSVPTSHDGRVGHMAGLLARQGLSRGGSAGSVEWIVAPFVLAPVFALLYPVTTAATLATAFSAEAIGNVLGLPPGLRFFLILLPTIAVVWKVGRMDQQWSFNRTYYRVRHVARLAAFTLAANAAAMNAGGQHRDWGMGEFFSEMVSMPNIMSVVLMLVFCQWMIMTADQWRRYWNAKLQSWRFRPKGYNAFHYPWVKAKVAAPYEPFELPDRMKHFFEPKQPE